MVEFGNKLDQHREEIKRETLCFQKEIKQKIIDLGKKEI